MLLQQVQLIITIIIIIVIVVVDEFFVCAPHNYRKEIHIHRHNNNGGEEGGGTSWLREVCGGGGTDRFRMTSIPRAGNASGRTFEKEKNHRRRIRRGKEKTCTLTVLWNGLTLGDSHVASPLCWQRLVNRGRNDTVVAFNSGCVPAGKKV